MQKIDFIAVILIILLVMAFSVFNKLYYCQNGICIPNYPPNLEGVKD